MIGPSDVRSLSTIDRSGIVHPTRRLPPGDPRVGFSERIGANRRASSHLDLPSCRPFWRERPGRHRTGPRNEGWGAARRPRGAQRGWVGREDGVRVLCDLTRDPRSPGPHPCFFLSGLARPKRRFQPMRRRGLLTLERIDTIPAIFRTTVVQHGEAHAPLNTARPR